MLNGGELSGADGLPGLVDRYWSVIQDEHLLPEEVTFAQVKEREPSLAQWCASQYALTDYPWFQRFIKGDADKGDVEKVVGTWWASNPLGLTMRLSSGEQAVIAGASRMVGRGPDATMQILQARVSEPPTFAQRASSPPPVEERLSEPPSAPRYTIPVPPPGPVAEADAEPEPIPLARVIRLGSRGNGDPRVVQAASSSPAAAPTSLRDELGRAPTPASPMRAFQSALPAVSTAPVRNGAASTPAEDRIPIDIEQNIQVPMRLVRDGWVDKDGIRHDGILKIFETSKDLARLYEAWGAFKSHYLNAMYEISQRLSSMNPLTGARSDSVGLFSPDERIRENARSEIVIIANIAEDAFAKESLEKAVAAFARRKVQDRSLFAAQLFLIENLRQTAKALAKAAHPHFNITDATVETRIREFQNAYKPAGDPGLWSEEVLSRIRTYIEKNSRFGRKSSTLWRYSKIRVVRVGNAQAIPIQRKLDMGLLIDDLFREARHRHLTQLNVELRWEQDKRLLTIFSKDGSFGPLRKRKNGFRILAERLSGTWDRGTIRSWISCSIPWDSPETPNYSIPPSRSASRARRVGAARRPSSVARRGSVARRAAAGAALSSHVFRGRALRVR